MRKETVSAILAEAFMRAGQDSRVGYLIGERDNSRRSLIEKSVKLVEEIDVSDKKNWPAIIVIALDAGVTEEDMMVELGSSASTLHRWINDGVAPREGTRRLMKRAIVGLLNERIKEVNMSNQKKNGRLNHTI